jgi:ferredoxin
MMRLPLSRLGALYEKISARQALYLPISQGGQVNFGRWAEGETVRLDAPKTVKSAKDFFFPQTETLAAFRTRGKEIQMEAKEALNEPFVVMGVRACDAASFMILDRVFLSDPVDAFYAARRAQGVIVSLACEEPGAACFCTAFGIDAAAPEGDVAIWIAEGSLYWQARTEKGEALTASVRDLFEEDDGAAVLAQQAETRRKTGAQPLTKQDLSGFGADDLDKFQSPAWKELSECCLGCGTCTFVCPTCQCYDIRDFDTGSGVQRYRCWDSCMYSDFTMMAHGTNRPTQLERFRQRFMHKLVYFPNRNDGVFACVGCGRCVEKCPSHMNIVKVARTLGKGEQV